MRTHSHLTGPLRAGLVALAFAIAAPGPAEAAGTLVVGMTAGNIPDTTGNPDQGFEGYRFVGCNLYDSLALWDLSKFDKPSDIIPGLATGWQIDPANPKRWIVKLRPGVKYHDGCAFSADDVVWNFQFRMDQKSPKLYWAPVGPNWGHYAHPDGEKLVEKIFHEFDPAKQLALLIALHELLGRDAMMNFVVHDLNPRAMSPKVQGFVQAQSWFQDLTTVSVAT